MCFVCTRFDDTHFIFFIEFFETFVRKNNTHTNKKNVNTVCNVYCILKLLAFVFFFFFACVFCLFHYKFGVQNRWAYTHPKAVQFWERQWLVNAILWGNFDYLRDAAINELKMDEISENSVKNLNILQMAAVYGNFSSLLCKHLLTNTAVAEKDDNENIILSSTNNNNNNNSHTFEIVDIAPIQLQNTQKKLIYQLSEMKSLTNNLSNLDIILTQNDSSQMLESESNNDNDNEIIRQQTKCYDLIYVFFLLHEQPFEVRKGTISECMRLLNKNGGKLVFVDYHRPDSFHPLYFVMKFVLTYLEPFAMDLWNHSIIDWIDEKKYKQLKLDENNNENENEMNVVEFDDEREAFTMEKETYFGGLYQKVVIQKV